MKIQKYIIILLFLYCVATTAYAQREKDSSLEDTYNLSEAVLVVNLKSIQEVDRVSLSKHQPFMTYTFQVVDVVDSKKHRLKKDDEITYSHAKYLKFRLHKLREKLQENKILLIFVGKVAGSAVVLKSQDTVFEVIPNKQGILVLKDPAEFQRVFNSELTRIPELKEKIKAFTHKKDT